MIMKALKHENLVELQDIVYVPRKGRIIGDIMLVENMMETDLNRVLTSKQELSIEHRAYFLYQMLRGLKFVHSAGIIHRDIKPSNALLNEDCVLQLW